MESATLNSKRLVWGVIGAAILFVLLAIIMFFVLLASTNEQPNPISKTTNGKAVATKDQIEQNLSDLKSDIKESISDQKAAEAALHDDTKRIDVGN